MSADLLRRAASLMRERAEAATPGPWHLDGPWWIDVGEYDMVTGRDRKAVMVPGEPTANPADAEHIAAADPPFMLAVADWLDSVADRYDFATTVKGEDVDHAAAVARTYLGEA